MIRLLGNPLVSSLLIIALLSTISYLPLSPFLGFYGDDFFFGYIAHFYGAEGVMKSLIIDRPLNGALLILNYFILGLRDHVFFWHIYMFLIRLLGGFALFFSLLKIWPKKLFTVTSITLLFLIYPGFLRQPLPLGFENYLTALTLWTISFMFTVFATINKSKFKSTLFTMPALILQILTFLTLEFFIGMEILRLLIIMLIIKNKISFKAFKKIIMYWIPYALGLALFVLWRILLFKSTRNETDISWVAQNYYSNPIWILKIPLEIVYSLTHTVIFAYFLPIVINFIRIPTQNSIASISLGIISSLVLYFYYHKIRRSECDKDLRSSTKTKKFGKELLIIGLISILGALVPIIISGRYVRLYSVYDRYTITSMIGVGFVLIGFLLFKITSQLRIWIMMILASLSITSHLMNGYFHTLNWEKQKDLWWQLYWRAPNIQDNAMLIFDFPPINQNTPFKDIINKVKWHRFYWVDYQIWAPGNLFFNYHNPTQTHFSGDFLGDKDIIDKIRNKVIESITDRNITYTRDFRNTVIISTPSDTSCLWVLDKQKGEFPSHANELLKSSITYSDVGKLVDIGLPITPPKEIFGREPPRGWCYYFQKASLARQLKDWGKLSQLKKEVLQKNLNPKDPNEWLPFLEDIR